MDDGAVVAGVAVVSVCVDLEVHFVVAREVYVVVHVDEAAVEVTGWTRSMMSVLI